MARKASFLEASQQMALQGQNHYKRSLHGALVVSGAKILGSGYNDPGLCYIGGRKYYGCHAEMMALKMSGLVPLSLKGKYSKKKRNNKRCDLWVVRVRRENNDELAMSYPCDECIWMMKLYGIVKVHYTDQSGNMVSERVEDLELRRPTPNWSNTNQTVMNPEGLRYHSEIHRQDWMK